MQQVEIELYDQEQVVGEYDTVGDAVMVSLVASDYLKLHRNEIFSSGDIVRILNESARAAQVMFEHRGTIARLQKQKSSNSSSSSTSAVKKTNSSDASPNGATAAPVE